MKEVKFERGDIVSWKGVKGEVWNNPSSVYSVDVKFENGHFSEFEQDGSPAVRPGRWAEEKEEPLKLVKKYKKKMERIKFKLYAHLEMEYPSGRFDPSMMTVRWYTWERDNKKQVSLRVPEMDKEVDMKIDARFGVGKVLNRDGTKK